MNIGLQGYIQFVQLDGRSQCINLLELSTLNDDKALTSFHIW